MSECTKQMPIVALRNVTVLPGMLVHFDVSRKFSIAAVEEAMRANQEIFLVTQKEMDVEEPEITDLFEIGAIASIRQIIKLPGNIIRVLVTGVSRAKLLCLYPDKPYLYGDIHTIEDTNTELTAIEQDAMVRSLHDLIEVYMTENTKANKEALKQLFDSRDVAHVTEQLAVQIPLSTEERQELLEITDFVARYEALCVILANEIEIIRIKKELSGKVKDKVDKNQKDYILREQLKVIREELGDSDSSSDIDTYTKRLETLEASEEVKARIEKEIKHLKNVIGSPSESAVVRGYVETLLDLPWDKKSIDNNDIKNAKKVLEKHHYGMQKVKDRILEFLSVRALTEKGNCPIICLVGPPGTGKTSIARSVAEALKKEYVRISLGGVRDEAEIRGHRRTYVGALPGRIIAGLKDAGVKNPLMLLDEIDKVSSDYKGDTAAALLEVLDAEQNQKFVDHYVELPVDLSEVLFIATANSLSTIPRPLLDRMEIVEVSSYTANEKLHIAKNHLLKKQMQKNGVTKDMLSISQKGLEKIISGYTREAGVRGLERKLSEICRKTARECLENGTEKVKITDKNVKDYLGKERYTVDMANETDEVGIVRGLAWTSVGGDTLEIEVNALPGKGAMELTGKLGDVMKESARTGFTFVRSIASEYGVHEDYFKKHDIHIHIPEGSVPKDGPSAGITMATAVLSAITGTKVRADIAMTGEITLRGRVLPIGGLKEKILAAKNAGIKQVLVPAKNRSDVEEIEEEIKDGIKITFVSAMQEVLKEAFVEA